MTDTNLISKFEAMMKKSTEIHLSGKLQVIFEDDWLVVVNKPSGLLSISSGKEGEMTAYSILTEYLGGRGGRNADRPLFIVHRLDRDTSGIMVFAKDFQTKELLQRNWNESVLERKYIALLEGSIDSEEGWIETWLRDNPKSTIVSCMGDDTHLRPERLEAEGWKFASSHCLKLQDRQIDGKSYTLVEFELETGRKNQIRVHAQWIGHPVAGDRKYGARTNPLRRLALHARTLSFVHPHTGKTLSFSSRLPKGFSR